MIARPRLQVRENPDGRPGAEPDVDWWEVQVLDGDGRPACIASSDEWRQAVAWALNPSPSMVEMANEYAAYHAR